MNVAGVNGTQNYQVLQGAVNQNNSQPVRQLSAAAQTPSEESKESSAVKSIESAQGTEGQEMKSINIYA